MFWFQVIRKDPINRVKKKDDYYLGIIMQSWDKRLPLLTPRKKRLGYRAIISIIDGLVPRHRLAQNSNSICVFIFLNRDLLNNPHTLLLVKKYAFLENDVFFFEQETYLSDLNL